MKTSYKFATTYPLAKNPAPIRAVLQELFLSKKMQGQLRMDKALQVNGDYLPFNSVINPGDQLDFTFTDTLINTQKYVQSGLLPEIIFEDENVLVINKPSGQKTHPNEENENFTAMNDAATYLAKTGDEPYMVHRLDMLTNGLLLIAKNPIVVPLLNRQLTLKIMQRYYFADVEKNRPLPHFGRIDAPLGNDPSDVRKQKIDNDGLVSVTNFEVISETKDSYRLKLQLETGRTHQIRVHLASIGAPIIGDVVYNPKYENQDDQVKMHLTAYKMEFMEPFGFTKKAVSLSWEAASLIYYGLSFELVVFINYQNWFDSLTTDWVSVCFVNLVKIVEFFSLIEVKHALTIEFD